MSALRYREVPPPADLRWAVECLWFAEGPGGGTERVVPDGCPELVVQLRGSMHAGGWAQLAAELEREFRRHAGLPPATLLESLGPLARAFVAPDRLRKLLGVGSVQDGRCPSGARFRATS